MNRARNDLHVAVQRVLELDNHLVCVCLRVRQHIGKLFDRRAQEIDSFEFLDPVRGRVLRELVSKALLQVKERRRKANGRV